MNTPENLDDTRARLTLFLYRVTMNEHLRNGGRLSQPDATPSPLSLDLHYLLTVWATNVVDEQVVLAWTMRQLHLRPVLDLSSLSPEADWRPGDVIHLIPAELSNEDVMRIWDALQPPYHLSVSYVARVIRIDPDAIDDARPVVATRFTWTDRGAEP